MGTVVLTGCAVWSLVGAAGRDGRPEGVLLAGFAVTAGYACGWISRSLLPAARSRSPPWALSRLRSRPGTAYREPPGRAPERPGHVGGRHGA